MSEDYYELLGVDPDATEEAILQAYRRKAAEHHPDVSDADDADDTFRKLNRAKSVLTDDERRREYDRLGHERFVDDGDRSVGPGDGKWTPDGTPSATDDVFGGDPEWPDALGTLLDHFFGRNRQGPMGSHRTVGGGARTDPFTIDLESLFRDAGRRGPGRPAGRGAAEPSRGSRECPKCHGQGVFVHVLDTGHGRHRRLEPCERCGGSGPVSETPG